MSKFTCGKWRVRGACSIEVEPEGCEKRLPPDKQPVRELAKTYGRGIEENMANARLIAAAPEMYGLLYDALQELKGYDPIGNGISTVYPEIEELLARIDGEDVKHDTLPVVDSPANL